MKEINIFTYLEDLIKFAAFAISIIALMISLKNRRNGIREHIFKEQFNAVKDLMIKINQFTFIIESKGVDDYSEDDLNKLENIILETKETYFSYQFLIVETKKINLMIHNQIFQMERIVGIVKSKEIYSESLKKSKKDIYTSIYKHYFKREDELLNKVQKKFHIKRITKENFKIFQ
ncbi:hypothetical protein [Empedobacter falsenii]|uniref:hypothetical protein n=1 Tax=Empedobacter falsenii TaxID=343874 RepID=UPI001C8E0D3F|nr:hypothetical protein [Empedobacter falsenii]MBY0066806.1 hypothetical protein [Empedobacter falsenii]